MEGHVWSYANTRCEVVKIMERVRSLSHGWVIPRITVSTSVQFELWIRDF